MNEQVEPRFKEPASRSDEPLVRVRRQWDSGYTAVYHWADLSGVHWAYYSGGVFAPAPWPFLAGYVPCDKAVSGELAHSCLHGEGPHSIQVCIVQRDNPPELVARLRAMAGPKPPSLAVLRRAGQPIPVRPLPYDLRERW
jgi:hypothetical protein